MEWLFRDISLNGLTLYDIGGGSGFISFYAAERGAREVICVEPLWDGSHDDMLIGIELARRYVVNGDRVRVETVDLRQFAARHHQDADILILHNVVNHLDEDACCALHTGDAIARGSFIAQFELLSRMLREEGIMIVADAGRNSFWTERGMRNPFAPTIDRSIHQQPEVWQELLEEAGFEKIDVRWTPFLSLMMGIKPSNRKVGSLSLSSYYSLGHFVLRMRKRSAAVQAAR